MRQVHIKAHEHDLAFTDYKGVICLDADCDFALSESSIIVVLKDVCKIEKDARWAMSEPPSFCPPDCKHLNFTECEQPSGINYPHVCKRYAEQVLHAGHHPDLVRLKQCDWRLL